MKQEISTVVMAGIVLYNSDFNRLCDCLRSLEGQVDKSVIFDNSPKEMSQENQRDLKAHFSCRYIHSERNIGMPEAMNRIMEIGKQEGYEWILTMNADSIVPCNMLTSYSRYFNIAEIGMICPQVIDKRRKYMKVDPKKKNKYIRMCITSAACTRVTAWEQVGKFDGWLFVDLLDNDISKRMILNGWKILQINSVILDQEFGEIYPKEGWKVNFWVKVGKTLCNDNFAKLSYRKVVHPNRVYFTCRNIVYLNKKFKNNGGIGYEENYNCHTFVGFIVAFVIPSILRSNSKIETIMAVNKGFKDGRRKKVAYWVAKDMQYAQNEKNIYSNVKIKLKGN